MSRTLETLMLRREDKFERHGVEVREESISEARRLGSGEQSYDWTFNFTHAVYVNGKLEGRAESRRSALKRAHQVCRNLEKGGGRRKRRRGN